MCVCGLGDVERLGDKNVRAHRYRHRHIAADRDPEARPNTHLRPAPPFFAIHQPLCPSWEASAASSELRCACAGDPWLDASSAALVLRGGATPASRHATRREGPRPATEIDPATLVVQLATVSSSARKIEDPLRLEGG